MSKKPILGITMGDPASIGPEITVKALALKNIFDAARCVVVGDKKIMENAIKITGTNFKINVITEPEEGDYSGQEFRQNVLHPALKKAIEMNVKLIVDLDGTAGLGTSFLEESFGGLIRRDHINYNILKQTLIIISDEDPDYKEEVDNYIEDAYEKEQNH